MARRLILLAVSFLFCSSAMAWPIWKMKLGSQFVPTSPVSVPGPSLDFDTGLVGFAMMAGAAFLARRRRLG
jgi:MYXO-CTERM domain-containing protein